MSRIVGFAEGESLAPTVYERGEETIGGIQANRRMEASMPKRTDSTEAAGSSDLMELLELQAYCCVYCGSELKPKSAELDHRVPRSKGGLDAAVNLQWLCKPCNRAKGEESHEAFVERCRRVAERHS